MIAVKNGIGHSVTPRMAKIKFQEGYDIYEDDEKTKLEIDDIKKLPDINYTRTAKVRSAEN